MVRKNHISYTVFAILLLFGQSNSYSKETLTQFIKHNQTGIIIGSAGASFLFLPLFVIAGYKGMLSDTKTQEKKENETNKTDDQKSILNLDALEKCFLKQRQFEAARNLIATADPENKNPLHSLLITIINDYENIYTRNGKLDGEKNTLSQENDKLRTHAEKALEESAKTIKDNEKRISDLEKQCNDLQKKKEKKGKKDKKKDKEKTETTEITGSLEEEKKD